MALDHERVEEALEPLRAAFTADGVRLQVECIDNHSIMINVVCGEETCRECILPAPQLQGVFRRALADRGISVDTVSVMVINRPE